MATGTLWIVIMNATRARILRGPPLGGLSDGTELILRSDHHSLREAIRQPHWHDNLHHKGNAPAADWFRPIGEDEASFASQVAGLLDAHRLAGDFNRLALFAAPDVLAFLRDAMPPGLARTVVVEVAENLIDLAEGDLTARVGDELSRLTQD